MPRTRRPTRLSLRSARRPMPALPASSKRSSETASTCSQHGLSAAMAKRTRIDTPAPSGGRSTTRRGSTTRLRPGCTVSKFTLEAASTPPPTPPQAPIRVPLGRAWGQRLRPAAGVQSRRRTAKPRRGPELARAGRTEVSPSASRANSTPGERGCGSSSPDNRPCGRAAAAAGPALAVGCRLAPPRQHPVTGHAAPAPPGPGGAAARAAAVRGTREQRPTMPRRLSRPARESWRTERGSWMTVTQNRTG